MSAPSRRCSGGGGPARRVFDRVIGLEEVPDGYRAMNDWESIKVMIQP